MSTSVNDKSWTSHSLFLLASIGSTVGLSNIWKFTYLAGENGGGAFVLVYILSLLIMGIPILAAEMLLGKRGRKDFAGTMEALSQRDGLHPGWINFARIGMTSVFIILSFYCVIAGWTADYTVASFLGLLDHVDAAGAQQFFTELMASPYRMMLGHGFVVLATVWIVALGVREGLERSINWMMPALFVILLALLIYSAFTGDFARAVSFLFNPDFARITPKVVLAAFGQAFFSLGIGLGVMLTYGAYMPQKSPLLSSVVTIAFSDGLVSILAGLAIFPIVFQYGLSPTEGPGLIFMTLPIAFKEMPGTGFAGAFFFILLFFAALTSTISILESVISRLEEKLPYSRKKITIVAGIALWLVGLGTVFSFNLWSEWKPLAPLGILSDKNFFETIDYLGSNLIMPLCGILMAVIAGWILKKDVVQQEMNLNSKTIFHTWYFLIRFIAPLMLAMVFLTNL